MLTLTDIIDLYEDVSHHTAGELRAFTKWLFLMYENIVTHKEAGWCLYNMCIVMHCGALILW